MGFFEWIFVMIFSLDRPVAKKWKKHVSNTKCQPKFKLKKEENSLVWSNEKNINLIVRARNNYFLDFTWHCSTAVAGLVTLDFISNTAFYTVKWVFSPQLHFPHSSIFLTAEGNRTCKFDQILWPMLSSTKISCLTGVLNPGLLSVKPRLYHWAKLPLLKMRGKTVKYILHKYILGYFGNQQKATDQINSRLNKQQKTTRKRQTS